MSASTMNAKRNICQEQLPAVLHLEVYAILCLLSSRPSTGIVTSERINYSLSYFFHIFRKANYTFLFLYIFFSFFFFFSFVLYFILFLSLFLFFTPLKFNRLRVSYSRDTLYREERKVISFLKGPSLINIS